MQRLNAAYEVLSKIAATWLLKPKGASAMTPTQEQIQERAFYLWEQRGPPEGSPEIDWERAERELRGDTAEKYTASWSRPAPKAGGAVDPARQR